MLEKPLEHLDDCGGSARGHGLPGAPGIDFLDQLGLDRDIDICFPFHAEESEAPSGAQIDNSRQKIDFSCRRGVARPHLAICQRGSRPSEARGV